MPELPAGTVTFLFSDIEGSTELLKSLGDRYAVALAAHHRILREAAAYEGGREIDNQGDAFFFVFQRARRALEAAVAAQRALETETWPDGRRLRVRMGLHTGEPIVGEERYIGLGVVRGARIAAAAHGGQILLSNATRELVEDELGRELELRDLGEHRLKDLDRPERLFQVVAPGLETEFPPVSTLTTQSESPFAGREGELAAEAAETLAPRRRSRVVAAGAAALVLGVAVAIAAAVWPDAAPLVAAPNQVAVVDVSDSVVDDVVDVGQSPGPIAVGEGAVWVGNLRDHTLSRIDLETGEVREIGLGFTPSGVVAGAASVWVTDSEEGRLVRRNAVTGQLQREFDLGDGGVGPAPVAFGGGFVWVANSNAFRVLQVDPGTNGVVATFDVDAPQFIGAGAEGVWVVEGATALVELEPGGGEAGRIPIEFDAGGLALGAGSAWVTDPDEDLVWRFDVRTRAPGRPTRVGQEPRGVAFAGDALWVANTLDGTVAKVDPDRDEVLGTVPVGARPEGLAGTGDSVWISLKAP